MQYRRQGRFDVGSLPEGATVEEQIRFLYEALRRIAEEGLHEFTTIERLGLRSPATGVKPIRQPFGTQQPGEFQIGEFQSGEFETGDFSTQ